MSERKLLACCIQSRDAFDTVYDHLEKGDLSEQGNIILSHLRDYYDRDAECRKADADLLRADVCRSLKSEKHRDSFGKLIESAAGEEVSPANVLHDFVSVKREAAGDRLASALASRQSVEKVSELVDEYRKWEEFDGLNLKVGPDLQSGKLPSALLEDTDHTGLIRVWPPALNDRLDGGMRRGHHMLLFARPEMGKTLMLVNMVAGFIAQDLKVLYVGNEDPMVDLQERLLCRITKMTKVDLYSDTEVTDALAEEAGYFNVWWMDAAPGTPREIEAALDEMGTADVVVIDQLRNINVKEDHFVQALEKAATAARNIAKKRNVLVVSVTQAGASAINKPILDRGDVDSSNTGIPAQVDVMVGLGASEEDDAHNRRILSLPKNKRSGKHEYFPVRIDPTISLVRNAS